MPIRLPAGVRATPIRLTSNDELAGVRVQRYSYELLDADTEDLLGPLEGVKRGGTLDYSASTAIKGSGKLVVADRGQDIDWLNVRIRITAHLATGATKTVGVWVPAAPVENWTSTGRTWEVELLDKNSILDQDIPTGVNDVVVAYSVAAGANVMSAVKSIITGVGEAVPLLPDTTDVLASTMTWDLGVTRLQIVNDLLEAIGYASLWVDDEGQYRTQPYVSPKDRVPVYQDLQPLVHGPTSLMSPEWQRDRDIYAIPNRYVAVAQGDGTTEGLIGVATNMDPDSPFSYPARGRWITRVSTGLEATSQEAIDARAKMGLAQSSSVTNGITVTHMFLPDMHVNDVIAFQHNVAGLDLLCYVTGTTVTLDPTALCKSEIREAVV